jgi:signal transduction histidine kinase
LDQEGKAMRALDVFDRQEGTHTCRQHFSLESSPDYLKAASQGRVIAATDVFKDPWTASMAEKYFRPLGIASVVNAPVRVAGKVPAMLCVAHTGSIHEWTPEEINFVAEVADQVAQAMLNAERQRTEQVIQRLTKDVANKTGHEFFRSIASSLGEVLEADIAFVAEVLPDQKHMRSLAMWVDGKEVPNILDDLTGTPCANVVSGSGCSYPNRVQERFPSDSTLVQAAAQAYFGMPLFSSTGNTFGLLAVLFRRPVENVGLVEAGLAAFAARAAAEMERLQNEEALRHSEARYKAFIANAQESIWRLEFEPPIPVDLPEDEIIERMMDVGILAEINDFGARLRGWSEGAGDIIGMPLRDLIFREHLKTDTLRMLIRSNFRFATGVVPVEHRDGSTQYLYRTGTAVIENGLLKRVWGTGQDMTALVQAQEEVRKLNATLEEQVRNRTTALQATVEELQAFSHSVSHDLRAPLLGIAGCSRALLEDYSNKLDPTALDWIKLIQRDAEHMDRLLSSLLALARTTQTEILRQPLDLTPMAKSVISVLRHAEPDRKMEVVIAEDIRGFGDPALLRVVLENLIGNAWKFSKTRPDSRIEVGVTRLNDLPTYFVRDNGVGFDPQYSSRLFGAFQRLHAGDFEGTGIGLATVRRVIHRHGGRVWAEGAVNRGATFYFTLGQPEESRA